MRGESKMDENAIIVFQGNNIRRTWFNDEWWFSVVDIIGVLTQTDRARKYWSDLKTKLQDEGFEVSAKIGQLKLIADDGKLRITDCVNTKNAFRIIQSIPSPKAEPFKQWFNETKIYPNFVKLYNGLKRLIPRQKANISLNLGNTMLLWLLKESLEGVNKNSNKS